MVQPILRSIDVRPFADQGRPLLLLRDPLGLSDLTVVVPQALGPLLAMLDGSRDVGTLRARMLVHSGLDVSEELILELLEHLDNALLLDNDHYAEVRAGALDSYRSASFRKPALAGNSYPADPDQLRQLLARYSADAAGCPSDGGDQKAVVGVISPHIDYERGGRVYAQVWQAASEAARAADLAIIFGTDHNSARSLITLTRQNYATPYGTFPTALPIVDAIAAAMGETDAFAEEINHQHEHSIELAAVWLHHARRGEPCQLVPILCGSFHPLIERRARPADDPILNATLEALRPALDGRRVIVVAAADLAHIGPAFGDPVSVDYVRYLRLQAADEVLIQTILQGSAEDFYQMIAREDNQRNVCGLPPIYMALRLLDGRASGTLAGYDRCPADTRSTSYVSICGVVMHDTSAR